MIVVSMFFPNTNQTDFDNIYYADSHYKNLKNLLNPLGLVGIEMQSGISDTNPETPPKYHAITNFKFESITKRQFRRQLQDLDQICHCFALNPT